MSGGLTRMVPIRFHPDAISKVEQLANAERLSVSAWIRRTVDAAVTEARSSEPCYQMGSGAWVHVRPACRCKNAA